MRGLGYRKEVGVVQMWSDMYRDHGDHIWMWLGTGGVREWTDVPYITPPSKVQRHNTTHEDHQEVARSARVNGML
jgi:hypothetical protein